MAMLTLNGTVANIYESPKGVNKETGEAFGGQHRIQVMCQNTLKNGEIRVELVDLSVDDISIYQGSVGKAVTVPVGVFVNGGKPAFYALKSMSRTSQ